MYTIFYILTIVVLTSSFLLFIIYHFFGNRELYRKTSHIPGPKTFPLIGCAYLFLGDSKYFMKRLARLIDSFPSTFRFILGSRVWIVIKDPVQIKTLLINSKTLQKDDIYKFAKPWVGNGLMTVDHQIWHDRRKSIQPTFHSKILRTFMSTLQKHSLLLTQTLSDRIDGPEFEILPYISYTIFVSIYENTIGMSIEKEKKEILKYLETNGRILKSFVERINRVWLHSDILFNFTQLSKDFYDNIKYNHNFTDNVIKERRQKLKIENKENIEEKTNFLNLMLKLLNSENKFTDQDIREQMDTIIIAGHDTTSRTLNFILLMLASHPIVQDKVYEELFNIYGTNDPEIDPINYDDLKRLEYLERVIKETMRLFPVAVIISRKALENFTLDGYTIPKDCGMIVSIFNLHRDEKIWHNPFKFDPDRFLPEEVKKRHPCSFIPFSFGIRDCIGRTYAMMSLKLFTATILRKYIVKKDKILKIEDIELTTDFLLLTTEPIILRIEKRVK